MSVQRSARPETENGLFYLGVKMSEHFHISLLLFTNIQFLYIGFEENLILAAKILTRLSWTCHNSDSATHPFSTVLLTIQILCLQISL